MGVFCVIRTAQLFGMTLGAPLLFKPVNFYSLLWLGRTVKRSVGHSR